MYNLRVELKFRELDKECIERVLEIERLSFPNPWNLGMFEREIALSISSFFVALLDDEVVGYGGYWRVEDEAHITNIAIDPKFRNRGFGKRILKYLLEDMKRLDISKVLLEVRESNVSARKLYEKYDFKVTGIRPRYYVNESAMLMERNV